MNNPLVTICIATQNRSELLSHSLKSALYQNYKNIELIIVDDGSTDDTENVVKKFIKKDRRIKLIRNKFNKGLSKSRNIAIKNASGVFFTFIDDDDLWEDNFVEEFVKLAQNYNKDWTFCCGNKNKSCSILKMEGNLKDYIIQGYTPPVAGQFYFLDTIKNVGGYNSKIKSGVDHDLWLKLACKNYKIKSLEKCLAITKDNPFTERLTTNPEKRINGIRNSLESWKDMIEKNFGRKFFKHFQKSYYYNIYKKFFIIAIRNKEYYNALKYFLKNPKKMYLIKKTVTSLTTKKEGIKIVQPSFPPFKK